MSREKWVKKQLRSYLLRELEAEEIKADLASLDDDIVARTVDFSRLPSFTNRRGSIVEYFVWKRAKTRQALELKLERLHEKTELMEKALGSLSDLHRSLITRLFLSLDREEDIIKDLGISRWQFSLHRRSALSHLYDELTKSLSKYQGRLKIEHNYKEKLI
jgi:DNA-directed RNA polymerase specialized sigma subunit